MTDDTGLKELAARMRQRRQHEPGAEWNKLAAGEASDEEIAALQQAEADGDVPPGTFEAFRPLDDDFRRRVAGLATTTDRGEQSDAEGAPEPIPFPARRPRTTKRFDLRPIATAATIVLALGALIAILPGDPVDPIPGYGAVLTGASSSRSGPDAAERPMYRPGDRFELRLTPRTPVEGPVVLQLYADSAGTLEMLGTPPPEYAPSGAVRVVGTVDRSVFLPAGDATLVAVVARPDALPSEGRLRRVLDDDTEAIGDGWHAWRLGVTFTP